MSYLTTFIYQIQHVIHLDLIPCQYGSTNSSSNVVDKGDIKNETEGGYLTKMVPITYGYGSKAEKDGTEMERRQFLFLVKIH